MAGTFICKKISNGIQERHGRLRRRTINQVEGVQKEPLDGIIMNRKWEYLAGYWWWRNVQFRNSITILVWGGYCAEGPAVRVIL